MTASYLIFFISLSWYLYVIFVCSLHTLIFCPFCMSPFSTFFVVIFYLSLRFHSFLFITHFHLSTLFQLEFFHFNFPWFYTCPGFAFGRPSQSTQLWLSTNMLTSTCWGQSWVGKELSIILRLGKHLPYVHLVMGPTFDDLTLFYCIFPFPVIANSSIDLPSLFLWLEICLPLTPYSPTCELKFLVLWLHFLPNYEFKFRYFLTSFQIFLLLSLLPSMRSQNPLSLAPVPPSLCCPVIKYHLFFLCSNTPFIWFHFTFSSDSTSLLPMISNAAPSILWY